MSRLRGTEIENVEDCSDQDSTNSAIHPADAFNLRKRDKIDRRGNEWGRGKRIRQYQQTIPVMPAERGLIATPRPHGLGLVSTLSNWEVMINHSSQSDDASIVETFLWQDDAGPLVISEITTPEASHHRLRMDNEFSVDVHQSGLITANCSPKTSKATLDHFLADQVFPRVLASEGNYVVHAAALRAGDRAFLLLGASGRGKSTLATSFALDGNDLLGDDATIIAGIDAAPTAEAVYPSLRLLPDSIAALLPKDVETFAIGAYTSKQRIAVPIARQAPPGPLPIAAIFLIGEPADEVAVNRASIKAACMSLVENSFALDPADVQQARHRLGRASRIAASVPAFGLCYPRDYARLAEVRGIIRSTLSALNEGTDRR